MSTPPSFSQFLGEMTRAASREVDEQDNKKPHSTPEQLRTALVLYQESFEFKVGDLVTWKPGMCNKRFPKEGEPAIVVDLPDDPLPNGKDDPSSAFYNEPLDLECGVIREGTFLTYAYFSGRMMPYIEQKKKGKSSRKLKVSKKE